MKKHLFILFAVLLFTGFYQDAKAQSFIDANYYVDSQGRPMKKLAPEIEDIDGTVFLTDKWLPGTIVNAEGVGFKNVKLKYNLLNDQLIFAGADDEMMAFEKPVKGFTINGKAFMSGFPAVDDLSTGSYYLVVADGNTKLLKHTKKTILETKTYGSAKPTRRFEEKVTWYVFKDDVMTAVKPDKKSILTALSDKSTQLNSYLAGNKVNFKNDADLSALIVYYNSL